MTLPVILKELRLPLGHSENDLIGLIARCAGRPADSIRADSYRIIKKSIDARRKPMIVLQYTIELDPQPLALSGISSLLPTAAGSLSGHPRPVVVGAGPAGLFAALYLSLAGLYPILFERGKPVEERQLDVDRFWQTGQLDPASNVQFGEGGAGTFSDGKLTSGIRDPRCRAILEELVMAGAPPEILFWAKPHVGTDHLRIVVQKLRHKILQHGGEIHFNSRLCSLSCEKGGNRLSGLAIEQQTPPGSQPITSEWPVRQLILAVGHSARDTFSWLADLPVVMEPKPFSLGVRIEHRQLAIDQSQYGQPAGHPQLPPAEYKLACHLPNGRSVYTFCMCPGGQVVASASETGGVVTNGMSYFARDQHNANSALLVGVDPEDFPAPGPLGGMHWQRAIEQLAYKAGGQEFRAPAQRLGAFLRQSSSPKISDDSPNPTYRPGVNWCDLEECLPAAVLESLRTAIPLLDKKLPGFAAADSILTGPETRSSSPLRILRDEHFQASLKGLYPCGEGAGYAGGIMSAAVDGLRCAEAVLLQR